LVKVKCRHCSAEIAVDATEPAAMQSLEATRKQPIVPRRKSVTQRGLGTPPAASTLATSSPLPDELPHASLPLNSTITPLPVPTPTPAPASLATDSIWGDDEETLAINLDKVKAAKAEVAQAADDAEDLEQIEAEEIAASEEPVSVGPISEAPVSSSGTPTLDALTMEAGGAHVPHGRAAPDEFLVQFKGGGDDNLGAPTIDVTSFAAEITPANVAAEAEEPELEERRARTNTVPLFDMNGVLPTPRKDESRGTAPSPRASAEQAPAEPAFSEYRARERKFVVPPEAAETPLPVPMPAPKKRKARRSLAPVWVGLVAAAGVAGAGFGYREHRMKDEAALASAAEPAPTQVVNTQAALPAEAVNTPTPVAAETESAAPTPATSAAVAPIAATTQNVTVASTHNLAPNSVAAVKSSAHASSNAGEPPSKAEPAVDKPAAAEKTIEAHNAPPAAAPDTEFDRNAARNALASAAAQASACRKEGDPSGTANLTITFAPSGRVTSAQIQGPPFSGTATGGCIATTMRHASVPAFSGDYVTVSKTIVIQ
jgi:hypothetical protein